MILNPSSSVLLADEEIMPQMIFGFSESERLKQFEYILRKLQNEK